MSIAFVALRLVVVEFANTAFVLFKLNIPNVVLVAFVMIDEVANTDPA